jgi:hypothetical protein
MTRNGSIELRVADFGLPIESNGRVASANHLTTNVARETGDSTNGCLTQSAIRDPQPEIASQAGFYCFLYHTTFVQANF